MQTMTIKEISEISGNSPRTTTRIAKELYPEKFKNGMKTIFDLNESMGIMSSLRKKGFVQPRQNVKVPRQNVKVEMRIDRIEQSLDRLTNIVSQLTMHQIEQSKNQIALPEIDYRKEISAIIRECASITKEPYEEIWGKFYNRCLYRLGLNISLQAKRAGIKPLDWAEKNGFIMAMYELAKEEF
jgi:predicted HicB family RNase H-like nuclease